MTRLLAGLEQDGFVKRSPDPTDGRVTRVSATARGRKVLEQGRDRRVAEVMAVLSTLTESERSTIARAVAALERALRGPAGG
jgi:DNA-binding MarR family transcriptional regulator